MKQRTEKELTELRRTRFWRVLAAVVAIAAVYVICLVAISAGWFGSLQLTPESVDKVVEAHEASSK